MSDPGYASWEVAPLDRHLAEQIRTFLYIDETEPIPASVMKTFTDYQAEPSGEFVGEPISESVVKWLLQLAELKYHSQPPDFTPGQTVYSARYREAIYCRPAAIGRALINCHGNFHAVSVADITPVVVEPETVEPVEDAVEQPAFEEAVEKGRKGKKLPAFSG